MPSASSVAALMRRRPRCRPWRYSRPRTTQSTITTSQAHVFSALTLSHQATAMARAMPPTRGPPNRAAMLKTMVRLSKYTPGTMTTGLSMPRMPKQPNSTPAVAWLVKPWSRPVRVRTLYTKQSASINANALTISMNMG